MHSKENVCFDARLPVMLSPTGYFNLLHWSNLYSSNTRYINTRQSWNCLKPLLGLFNNVIKHITNTVNKGFMSTFFRALEVFHSAYQNTVKNTFICNIDTLLEMKIIVNYINSSTPKTWSLCKWSCKMSNICGCLWETVAYERSDHRGSKVWVIACNTL